MSPVTPASPIAAYFDMWFYPANGGSTVFRGTMVLSKYVRNGYWQMPNVKIVDAVGRERYESSLLYGWKCYIDSPLEDIVPPQVQPGTSSLTLRNGTLTGHPVQIASFKFTAIENTGLEYYLAELVPAGLVGLIVYALWARVFRLPELNAGIDLARTLIGRRAGSAAESLDD